MTTTDCYFGNIVGKTIYHTLYGYGTITELDECGRICVEHESGKLVKYPFPYSVINGFLVSDDVELYDSVFKLLDEQESLAKDSLGKLLMKIKEVNPRFEGLVHTTSMCNFTSIIKDGILMSRGAACRSGKLFVDAADTEVINHTSQDILDKVRFYWGVKTPTNYSAAYDRPVIMIFSPFLLKNKGVIFCNGNAASAYSLKTTSIEKAIRFNWKEIFERGPFWYGVDNVYEKRRIRNAEVLYPGNVETKWIKKVIFQSKEDYEYAKEQLGELLESFAYIIDHNYFAKGEKR